MPEHSTAVIRAAWIGGIFAIIAAFVAGVFLLLNTAFQSGLIGPKPTATSFPDSIKYFQIVEVSGKKAVIEVAYTYDRIHGNNVCAGAWFLDKGNTVGGGGFIPAKLTSESGVATVTISPSVKSPQKSDEIKIILYECGKSEFVSKQFPFVNTWQP